MSGTNPLPAGQWANIANLGAGVMAPGAAMSGSPGQAAANARPLRGPPVAFIRQPYLGGAPIISSITGFGAGSGAGIRNNGSDADQSQGLIRIIVGLGAAAPFTIGLVWGAPIPAGGLVFLADWAPLSYGNVGTTVTVTGATQSRPLVPGEILLIAYQWAVSN